MGRILPGKQRHLLPEDRQIESPIDEQQHAAHLASSRKMVEQQPGSESESHERLYTFNYNHRALKSESGVRPLDEQGLVLTPDGFLRPVGADRDKAKQRVKVEAA